jgi:type I restriction enzyme R subunit
MSPGREWALVEEPFIQQLLSMGWKWTTGNIDDPSVTGRGSFREVLIRDDLEAALRRINLRDGEPWLDDERITQAINALERHGHERLLEANEACTELLLKGTVVDGVKGWDQGRRQTVQFIHWSDPERNTFRVVNQFRVDEPGGQAKKWIQPDLVLFVNGIPLAVVECKDPHITAPMYEAIDQLQRYANQRGDRVEGNEGAERLFHTNQLVIATCFDEARVGTFTSGSEHFLEWKDTAPVPMAQVAKELGKASLVSQEKLVAGALRPAHLLDLVKHFTLFMEIGGQKVKIIGRYQQYRAAWLAIRRMKTGARRGQQDDRDHRGGIVWHTQGSGKSLTMVFLIRKMRSDPDLRRFKVVMITDRKDLQKQLAATASLTDEPLTLVQPRQEGFRRKSSVEVLQETLQRPGRDLVFAMIQKYRGPQAADEPDDDEGSEDEGDKLPQTIEPLPVLNESEEILVLVDEAHRSHTSALHANLDKALPRSVRIGFTGTPIIMGQGKRTHSIFGSYIDRYTIRQAEDDGAVVRILYEGRTSRAAVRGGGRLDKLFDDLFDRTPEEIEQIKRRWATRGHVLEAPDLIAAKARDMLDHYVANVLPNGFKAQVVAVSRRATLRYREALLVARDELVAELEALDPSLPEPSGDPKERHDDELAFLLRARRFLPELRELEFAPVISGGNNDDPTWKEWTTESKIEDRIRDFKKPLRHPDPEKRSPLAILIVKSMLLTGFDAPVEQVMYLDRRVQGAELLQAIARVNRRCGEKKRRGFVVDYFGVAHHLTEALKAYVADDIEGAFQSLRDELPKLGERHRRVLNVFAERGLDLADEEACIRALRDERLRAEFHVKLKQFLQMLDVVLPRAEGLDYVPDAKRLSLLQARARNRYRSSERLIGKEVGEKVRKLIDDHIQAQGIDPRIPPISLTDAKFGEHVDKHRSSEAKASEMEHALRYHLRKKLGEDPEFYGKLSKRLDQILMELEGQWDALAKALRDLIKQAQEGREEDDTGLDPRTQAPFFDALKRAMLGDAAPDDGTKARLVRHTVELVEHLQQELALVGFWSSLANQQTLRMWIFDFLDGKNDQGEEIVPFERLDAEADKLVALARRNHTRLVD